MLINENGDQHLFNVISVLHLLINRSSSRSTNNAFSNLNRFTFLNCNAVAYLLNHCFYSTFSALYPVEYNTSICNHNTSGKLTPVI
jgi:hypothetical protein